MSGRDAGINGAGLEARSRRGQRGHTAPMRNARLVVSAGILTPACLLLTGCALFDNHSQLTIALLMENHGDTADVTTDPIDITADACGTTLDCVEAYRTEEADYYRFASRDEAAEHAATLDDGFVVHYIVMDFAGKETASKEHQRWAMERLAGTWQDYHGTFPDR